MDLDDALHTFIAESRELLADMEDALLNIEQCDDRAEAVNAIFRAAHTIKGSAGLFGFDHIVEFTHIVESVLDRVRNGALDISDELVSILLASRDHINALIDGIAGGAATAVDALRQDSQALAEQLRAHAEGESSTEKFAAEKLPAPADDTTAVERLNDAQDNDDHWHISLRFGPDVMKNGMDPLSFIRYLETVGTIEGVLTLLDGIPPAAEMDPENCYLGFEIAFRSSADKAAIESVFDFVKEDCRIGILPPRSRIQDYVRLLQDLPADASRLGEMLVRCGTVTAAELEAALHKQSAEEPPRQLGAILVEHRTVHPEVVDAALTKQKQVKDLHAQDAHSIRIDAEKLDQLINLVGELIIAGAGAGVIARRAQNIALQESMSKVAGLVEAVRDSALQLRMVKIGATFNRFQRVVHDVAREIGKDIALEVSGEDTELDKTVVEKIGDPLTHLVRNAMDHGIEPAEVRLARGKPARGTVRLDACHDSGSIVIAVSDDGGGLNRDRILAKAIERGLVEPGKVLSDAEVYRLIFEPGLSTAEQVSNLSGRGVGMDVVKRNITALRGSVEVRSTEGQGTTVTVRLPLTLAIIDGFLVEVGKSVFAIPLDMIEECIAYSAEPGHDYTNLRGEVLPFIRLRELFAVEGAPQRRENIVVLKHAGKRAGLVVDRLLGEFQTVIKPLGKIFSQVKCISGSTILGSGEVALILDVPALVQHACSMPDDSKAIAA